MNHCAKSLLPVVLILFSSSLLTPCSANQHVPDLFELDNWTQCMEGPGHHKYCMVRVIVTEPVMPDGSSPFAVNDLQHFRRSLLDRGVCLKALPMFSEDTVREEPKLPNTWNVSDRYIMERELFPPSMHPDERTELAARVVINRQLQSRHPDLNVYSEIEYCVKKDPTPQYELAIGISLAVAVVLGCVLLFTGRRWILGDFVASPSVMKSTSSDRFLLFDLYKSYGMVGLVLSHCYLFGPFLMPLENVDQLEHFLAHPNVKMYRLLCPFLMLVFFTMSSMLLTVKLLHGRRKETTRRRPTFVAIVTNRLIRLQPLNLLTLGFCALAYDHFVRGPLGPRQLIVERGFCRSRWWMNALFISNFSTYKPCLPQSWFISAEFQLFLLLTIVLLAIFRWPHRTGLMLGGSIVFSFLGPFLTVLWTDFDPVGPANLHEMRFFLMDSEFMAQLYTPFYNNLCWSVGGMVAGFMYDHFQRSTTTDSVARQRMLIYLNIAVMIALTMLVAFVRATYLASEDPSPESRWWLAVCYSSYKLSAAAFFSMLFLRVLLTERDYYGSAIAKLGSKLYYCVYLIHMPIFRIVFSNETAVTKLDLNQLSWMTMKVFGISYVLAFLLHYTFEKPVMRILRRLLFHRG